MGLTVSSCGAVSSMGATKFAQRRLSMAIARDYSPSTGKVVQNERFMACWASFFAETRLERLWWANLFAEEPLERSCWVNFFAEESLEGSCWANFFAEEPMEGLCWASIFAETRVEGVCWASLRTGSRGIPRG